MGLRPAALVAVATCVASSAFGADGDRFGGYRVDTWRDEHGLPQNTVTGIAQDGHGFLWATTFGGVVRFDGIEFDLYDLTSGLLTPRALSIAMSVDRSVWVGLEGRGLERLRHGRVAPLPEHLRIVRGDVREIVSSADRMWIVHDWEVKVATDQGWRVVAQSAGRLVADGNGGVWFTRGNKLWHGTEESSVEVLTVPESSFVLSMASPDSALWFVTDRGLFRVEDGEAKQLIAIDVDPPSYGAGPVIDRDGRVWFSVDGTVYQYRDVAQLHQTVRPDEQSTWPSTVRVLYGDRERNVWLGVSAGGLWRLTPEPFDVIVAKHSTHEGAAGVVPVEDGLIFGSFCGLATHLSADGTQRPIDVYGCINALWYDAVDQRLWVCSVGLEEHGPDGKVVHALPDDSSQCSALLRDRRGRLWVGAQGRISIFDAGKLTPVDTTLPDRVSTIAEHPDGSLWIGQHGRIVVLDGDTQRALGPEDGVPLGEVRTIHFSGDSTFIGTYGGGLARLTPNGAKTFDRHTGLIDNFVSFVTTDGDGRLWLSGNHGVVQVPLEDFDAVAEGRRRLLRARVVRLGEAEGRPNPAGWFDGEKLWIATVHGLGRIHVDRIVTNDAPPVAVIQSATVDGVPLSRSRETIVPPGRGELRVSFRAALLRAPRLRAFETKLEGLEREWVRVAEGRAEAIYAGLAPGHYRFHVRAINEDRVVGPAAMVPFELQAHFSETNGFRAALGLMFLVAAWMFARLRTQGAERRNRALTQQIESRLVAEAAVRDSETHYRSIFTSSVNGFFVIDDKGVIIDVNPSACTMFGYSADEIIGERVEVIVPGAGLDHFEVQLCVRKDGSSFEARLRETTYSFERGLRTVLTVVDLSPLVESQRKERRLREQLLHSQRVEAMGRLAGGIAHDVNNMLTAVKCYADLAIGAIDENPKSAREDLLEITAGVERTTKLTKQLLAFGQRETAQPRDVSLAEVIESVMPMLSRLSRDDIEIVFEVVGEVSKVYADPTHLEQIIVNLVINASHAMPDGGKISIAIDDVEPPFVRLVVQDEGVGMTEEVRDRIFEPFFTTKESQESSGLGLSVVHGIVTQSGGRISVDSTPGHGSRFEILLPRSEPSPIAESEPRDSGPIDPAGGERLLYCDDDEHARRATARILRHAGYDVVVAGHPVEALSHAAATPIDLLITDVVMPDMNGRELYEALRSRDPGLRVLYVSGYARDHLHDLGQTEHFLPKPYPVKDLLAQIRSLIDQGHEAPPPTSSS